MASAGVLLVEDDEHTRARLASAVETHPRLRLLGQAASCAEAQALLEAQCPDVLLTDLGLPDGSGVELIRALRRRHPQSLAMVITVFADERHVVTSLEAGASSYLLKDGTDAEIGRAIEQLLDGGSPISPSIARHVLKRFHALPASQSGTAPGEPAAAGLSPREREVLGFVAKGFSYAEIAELLGISVHTVTSHVRHIYEKLAVHSRAEAVYEAAQLGLIQLDRQR
jgi:DNA-binding NarL/FixJ family response regulator